MPIKLTKRSIDAISAPERGDVVVWDTELRRFGLRVVHTGTKSFIIQYRNAYGRSRRKTLGQYPPLTPDQARRLAQAELARVAHGDDPAQERKEALGTLTVRDVSERYLTEYVKEYSTPRTHGEAKRSFDKYILPAIGQHPIHEVTRRDLVKLHQRMRKTPALANRVMRVASGLFSYAIREGFLPADAVHPARGVTPYREKRRERFLSSGELVALGEALTQLESSGDLPTLLAEVIRLIVLTGCRVGEILGLSWAEVDLERRFFFLGDSKTGQKPVPLGAPAIEILKRLPRRSPWVFPSPKKAGAPYASIRRAWYDARDRAGLPDVRIHDLRHTTASVAAECGISLQAIGKILGHSQVSTTARYAHLGDDLVRAAAERVQGRIVAALAGSPKAAVVPLRRGG